MPYCFILGSHTAFCFFSWSLIYLPLSPLLLGIGEVAGTASTGHSLNSYSTTETSTIPAPLDLQNSGDKRASGLVHLPNSRTRTRFTGHPRYWCGVGVVYSAHIRRGFLNHPQELSEFTKYQVGSRFSQGLSSITGMTPSTILIVPVKAVSTSLDIPGGRIRRKRFFSGALPFLQYRHIMVQHIAGQWSAGCSGSGITFNGQSVSHVTIG